MNQTDINEKEEVEFIVPSNVSSRFEFFGGFGWSELRIVIFIGIISCALFYSLGLVKEKEEIKDLTKSTYTMQELIQQDGKYYIEHNKIKNKIRISIIIIPVCIAFFAVKKNPQNGMSLIDLLRSFNNFKKSQKRYLYKQGSGKRGN